MVFINEVNGLDGSDNVAWLLACFQFSTQPVFKLSEFIRNEVVFLSYYKGQMRSQRWIEIENFGESSFCRFSLYASNKIEEINCFVGLFRIHVISTFVASFSYLVHDIHQARRCIKPRNWSSRDYRVGAFRPSLMNLTSEEEINENIQRAS